MSGPGAVDLQNAAAVEDLFHAAADALRTAPCRPSAYQILLRVVLLRMASFSVASFSVWHLSLCYSVSSISVLFRVILLRRSDILHLRVIHEQKHEIGESIS